MGRYAWEYSDEEYFNKYLKIEYPECKGCAFLNVISYKDKKCKCFYMVKDRCILRGKNEIRD